MRPVSILAVAFLVAINLPNVVFGEQGKSVSLASLQNPIALPATGLKYETTLKSEKNGHALATVIYDFELMPTKQVDQDGQDHIVAQLIPKKLNINREDLQTISPLSAEPCIIHITQSVLQSVPAAHDDGRPGPAVITPEQRQANELIVGLLLFRLEGPATRPISADKTGENSTTFTVKSPSPRMPLSDAVVQNDGGKNIVVNFKNVVIGNSTTKPDKGNSTTKSDEKASSPNVDSVNFRQSPFSGSCEVDAATGWIANATVEQTVKVGVDQYRVQISVRAVQDFGAEKTSGSIDIPKRK